MPAVVVDSSVLITLAAGEQFHLLREFYAAPVPSHSFYDLAFSAFKFMILPCHDSVHFPSLPPFPYVISAPAGTSFLE